MSCAFLSYARSDVDPYFETFYSDFVKELRGLLGNNTTDDLVFRDSSDIPLGAEWEAVLERQLLACRTLIAMLSPTYVRRPACGKEWASFEWRLSQAGAAPDLLLPLIWIPIPADDVPPAVRARQAAHVSLGATYARRGLRHVVQRAGTEYQDLLTALAERVRDLTRQPALAPVARLLAPGQLPDPFKLDEPALGTSPAAPVARSAGPPHVEFFVVAPRHTELAGERTVVAAYGAEFDEWCPYLPALDTRIGLLIQKVAFDQGLTAALEAASQNIVAQLQDVRTRNTLAVLVVDVWSLRLRTYRAVMNLFDRAERFANAGVLVVWNLADGEASARRDALGDALRLAFPNLTVMRDPLAFHDQIGTPDELAEKLRDTLQILRRRIVDFGEVMRRAEGGVAIPQPMITGPGATT